jgi:dTDP-4-amino-4,6-dideoxygalactose transaminase
MDVPFNCPRITPVELEYIQQAAARLKLSGNGHFTKQCQQWIETRIGCAKALLTHSGTGALELAALLSNVASGDEVIMPSFTFSSTANAFVLRGATPVFVDVLPSTLNIDPAAVAAAITPRTRVIVPVHYAGVACDMTELSRISTAAKVPMIEDAAQALGSSHRGRPLGSFGVAAALSFHETKNIIAGEGGAVLVNDPAWAERAEILWEKGTNRAAFFRGQIDRYTWCDIGSSFLPSEIIAAFLWGQLERAETITTDRLAIWHRYHTAFAPLEQASLLRRPVVPEGCEHNGHIYYLIYPDAASCDAALDGLRVSGIDAVRHYVPLHSAPAGLKFGRTSGSLDVTTELSMRLLRLPLWVGMSPAQIDQVITSVLRVSDQERQPFRTTT